MRALFAPAALFGLAALLLAPAAPFLAGCDADPTTCDSGVELEVEDRTPAGTTLGATVRPGDCLILDYEGRRASDGVAFQGGTATSAALFTGNLIPGFQIALVGSQSRGLPALRTGQSVRITIPPELAYGIADQSNDEGTGIPACSVLQFDVTVRDTATPSRCVR